MNITVSSARAYGTVCVPPSKSYTHRALIAAACADGISHLTNALICDDTMATVEALRQLGAVVTVDGTSVTVKGCGGVFSIPANPIFCRASASTYRFLAPLGLLSKETVSFSGNADWQNRRMNQPRDFCMEYGFSFSDDGGVKTLKGPLKAGFYSVDGTQSSQLISGLLMALPLAKGESRLSVRGEQVSAPYLRMTEETLRLFGVSVEKFGEEYHIFGKQNYQPTDISIEGDAGSAAFLQALAHIEGNAVTLTGVPEKESCQGDARFSVFSCLLTEGCPTISVKDCPDLMPILTVVAAMNHGAILTDVARLCDKESDRIAAMQNELASCGISIERRGETLIIPAGTLHTPVCPLWSHRDHRIAMALAVLLTKIGGTIRDADCVQKSYPDFWDALRQLHIPLTIEENAL